MARDLMFQQEIKQAVQHAYAAIPTGAGETVARRLYTDQELAEVPPGPSRGPWGGQPRPLRPAPAWPDGP